MGLLLREQVNSGMRKHWKNSVLASLLVSLFAYSAAQNPIIRNQFSADPSARVFGNRVYVYPSHDILAVEGKGRVGWFCMEDYHVFSSANLTDWVDHGMIVQQNSVPWVRPNSYSMWAPDCIERNGKFYFYFPSSPKDTAAYGRGFTVGVAIADKPEGPFVPQAMPIKGVRGIDPNVFIDKDGQAYLYWASGNIFVAKLKENMLELASEPKIVGELPQKGLKEGPYLFERNGLYYMTYPHVEAKTERLEYAIGNSPLGPFRFSGVIMDESPTGCWTNHQSIIEWKGQWYLFYHHNDYSPSFDKARSVRADSLFFNDDGTIRKVLPTLRGPGITLATKEIQVDRYSRISESGAHISFLDTLDKFRGWETVFENTNGWIQYNSVDFGKKSLTHAAVKARSRAGGILQVRANSISGPVLAELKIPKSSEWKMVEAPVLNFRAGVQHLFVVLKEGGVVEADWLSFK